MPGSDGIARALKASRDHPQRRNLLMTAFSAERGARYDREALVNRVIAKPFPPRRDPRRHRRGAQALAALPLASRALPGHCAKTGSPILTYACGSACDVSRVIRRELVKEWPRCRIARLPIGITVGAS
jgi:hypothetical protein